MKWNILGVFLLLWCVVSLPVWTLELVDLPIIPRMIAAAVSTALMIALPLWARKEWKECASFDMTMRPNRRLHYMHAAVFATAVVAWDIVSFYATREVGNIPSPKAGPLPKSYLWFSNMTLLVFLGPIAEEIFWRGYALEQFQKFCQASRAVLLHATLFGAHHVLGSGVHGFVQAFGFGVIFGYYRIRYRALLPIIICHAVLNVLYVLPSLLVELA